MIKNKKFNSVVAVVSACSLMAGFTSEAAPSQPEGRMVMSSSENNIVEIHRDTFQVMPDTLVVSAKDKIESEQKKIIEEIKRKEREAKEKAEREAAALRNQYQELMASIIFCEAGNQPYEGQVAVGAVIMNRVRSASYPNSIEAVIYQSGQFTPASTGWLDRVRNSRGYTATSMQAAADALAGANPIGGCLYFDQGGRGMKIGAHYFH
ncbi:MAG: cell wall hydrolase [Dorea sp.]|nr:cell wall hydrolase [Dorea sp.]MCI9227005.1 cell wall hydrolase [Dorea sp.]